MVLGVFDEGERSAVHEVDLRRYRCLSCHAVSVVGPWDILPGMLYTLLTVVLALAKWAQGCSEGSVRAQLGVFPIVGVTAQGDWASLRR